MKNLFTSFSILVTLIYAPCCYSQSEKQPDCLFLKDCQMKYLSVQNSIIKIKDSVHIEYIDGGKYYIKSKLEWVNDCEYNATVTDFTWPKFSFPIGEVLNAKVTNVKNDTIFIDLAVRDFKIKAKYKLID